MNTGMRGDPAKSDLEQQVAAAKAGDEVAFRAVFDATYREVRLFVAARATSEELVDEVVQATYVAAFEGLAGYRAGGAFAAWLKGIARHLLLREFSRRTRLAPLAGLAEAVLPEPADDALGARLDDCLGRLSPTARELLELRYQQRLQVQEIGARLGRSASSISVTLFRLRDTLADCLGPEVVGHG
jgi:RNA polymerase sigma-70 factor (ECF subfamily)